MSTFTQNHSKSRGALRDLWTGLKLWRLWTALAWNNLHQRYKRTWIGMGWVGLSFALFAIVKIVIFGPISGKDLQFFGPNLAAGLLAFRLIANFISGGARTYVGAQNWIKSEPLPLSIHLYTLMANNFIIFFFGLIPATIICLYFNAFYPVVFLSLPLIVIVFAINGLWVSSLVGILCARYRDLMHFIGTVMQAMYFVTPILWVPPETGMRATLAEVNPLTHYLALFREPILYGTIPWHSWKLVCIYTIVGISVSFTVFSLTRLRIIYWL